MAKGYWIALGIAGVILAVVLRNVFGGHHTPPGQPQLMAIGPQSVSQFTEEFNRDAEMERVVLLLSPTCPVCLRGSSAVDAVLQRHPGSNVRVFAVWEPMLPTDWEQPSTHVLARLSDPRVIQVWDRNHLLAGLIARGTEGRHPACCNLRGNLWDVIATYSPGVKWATDAPAPQLLDGTIVRTVPKLEAELAPRS